MPAPAPRSHDGRRRLLVVVSHDFGEFGLAQDFLADLAHEVDLDWRLPPHLYALNPRVGPHAATPYASGREIIEALGARPPAAVLLFSGHLLVPDQLLGLVGLRRLVRTAGRLGVPVCTSDPFLGLTRDFRWGDMVVEQMPAHRAAGWLARSRIRLSTFLKCRATSRVLRPARVIAPFPAEPGSSARCHYFREPADTDPPALRWVFVLAGFDLQIQLAELGPAAFIDGLLQRLHDPAGQGRGVTLVAPAQLCGLLQGRVGPGVTLAPQLGYEAFQRLVGSAERVFYWNMVSHSLYQRLVQLKPVHFFDRGHVARVMPRLFRQAVATYFDGHEPALCALDRPLRLADLAHQETVFVATHRARVRALRHLPTPRVLLRDLGVVPWN